MSRHFAIVYRPASCTAYRVLDRSTCGHDAVTTLPHAWGHSHPGAFAIEVERPVPRGELLAQDAVIARVVTAVPCPACNVLAAARRHLSADMRSARFDAVQCEYCLHDFTPKPINLRNSTVTR